MKVNKLFFYVLLPVFVGALVLDLVTKSIAATSLIDGESITAIPALFNFKYVQNFGAAWSMFSGNTVFLLITTIVFVVCLGVFYAYENKNGALFQVGIGLVFAGAFGNLIDRIFLGYVRDFIQFDFWQSFPIFNVADICLCVGVVILIVYYIIKFVKERKNARKN